MFDPQSYGPAFAPLLAEERLNELGPGRPNAAAGPALRALSVARAFEPHKVQDPAMAEACLAGLWLYHDFLDQSHAISQGIATATGSYWHSLMHRRQPDSWNSKYWLDRTGRHPIFPALRDAAARLAAEAPDRPETRFLIEQAHWDPYRFVDLCEAARTGRTAAEPLCRRIQLVEWRLLFDHCYRRAIGA
ncbi:hypothetical protein [Candidatus Methylocalor cossyra]|uniref:Uncharacterized protein n=1 Tax=Candidatus Methylocalor cossyra TaxID=3108543 RepID=A0ABP1C718_9GAMM